MSCTRAAEIDLDAVLDDPHSSDALAFLTHCRGCTECAAAFERHQAARPVAAGAPAAAGGRRPGAAEGLRASRRGLGVAIAAALCVGAVGWWAFGAGRYAMRDPGSRAPAPAPASTAGAPVATVAPPPLPPGPPPAAGFSQARVLPDGSVELVWGEKLSVATRQLPRGDAFALTVRLPVALEAAATIDAKFGGPEGMLFVGHADVQADDLHSAHVEIPRRGLELGEHMLELRTTEHSHLPLRRYLLEIR